MGRKGALFTPGAGRVPDVVAGRADVEALLALGIRAAGDGDEGGTRPLLLLGPRGVGKTVLCTIAEEMAAKAGMPTVTMAGANVATKSELAETLVAPGPLDRVRGIRAAGFGVEAHPKDAPSVEHALAARAKERGLLIVADEAHEMDAGVAHVLTNAVQREGRKNVFLLLAGTPVLDWKRSAWKTTFDEPLVEKRLGPLSNAAVREAITLPLQNLAQGVAVTDEALETIERECMGFPFFVQVWGELIELSGATRVDPALIERMRAGFEDERDKLYRARWRRLRQSGLAAGALALVEEGLGTEPMQSGQVYECVAKCYRRMMGGHDALDGENVEWIVRGLVAEGVLWDLSGGMDEYVAGTPPTMTSFLATRPAPTKLETEGVLWRFLAEQTAETRVDASRVASVTAEGAS
ncbi:MAG: AAA family ATPase [Gammaproteobacteria bacterium]|nr:AAA family ATPase [Gammaproteobacteria bacterium]